MTFREDNLYEKTTLKEDDPAENEQTWLLTNGLLT